MVKPRDPTFYRKHADSVDRLWRQTSRWSLPERDGRTLIDFGRIPLHPAICDESDAIEAVTGLSQAEARGVLRHRVLSWPADRPRIGIEAGTGLGKTTVAIERAAKHAVATPPSAGVLLYVVHDRERVASVVTSLRNEVVDQGGDAGAVSDLLGRQTIASDAPWSTSRFGCRNHDEVQDAGKRGRHVRGDVCRTCPWRDDCERHGYLAHSNPDERVRVLVTTRAKLRRIPDGLWKHLTLVICDEDVLDELFSSFVVYPSDLERAARWIREQGARHQYAAALPLVNATLDALRAYDGDRGLALRDTLAPRPTASSNSGTVQILTNAVPRGPVQLGARRDPNFPAPWERAKRDRLPRQVWGRFAAALASDFRSKDERDSAILTIHPGIGATASARVRCDQIDLRTARHLRARPLLLLDATLHPALDAVLDVERETIHYRQGRTVIQVLCALGTSGDLTTGRGRDRRLNEVGRRRVAQVAAFVDGRRGYVLCKKGLIPLLELEAARYYELRRCAFVNAKRERGWNAAPDASRFVVLGRYAAPPWRCRSVASALRAGLLDLTGTTASLRCSEAASDVEVFRGRGRTVRLQGEIVERRRQRWIEDPLAQLIQDWDRISSVRQFIGRDRTRAAHVLLLRGDATVGVDALIQERDLPTVVPAGSVPPTRGPDEPGAFDPLFDEPTPDGGADDRS